MRKVVFPSSNLTDAVRRGLAVLTLAIIAVLPSHASRATDYTEGDPDPMLVGRGNLFASPFVKNDENHRVGVLLDYVRKEVPSLAPGLPSIFRDPAHWMLNGLRDVGDGIGLHLGMDMGFSGTGGDDTIASILQPVASLMEAPAADEGEAMWLSPDYHHKGFLPFNDALVMAVSLRHSLADERVRFEVRPFYGQNLISQRGYYGAEMAINLSPKLGLARGGKIVLGYTEGHTALLDHGRGFDLHSEIPFTEHLNLQAGMRQSDLNSGAGNYVTLRWKMAFP